MLHTLTNTTAADALKTFGNLSFYNEGGYKTTLARELPTLAPGERLDVAMWRHGGIIQLEVYVRCCDGLWCTDTYIARC